MDEQFLEALDDRDQRILDEVRELYARWDPCPAGLNERIKFALTVQALNAEVAELTRGGATAGVRSEREWYDGSGLPDAGEDAGADGAVGGAAGVADGVSGKSSAGRRPDPGQPAAALTGTITFTTQTRTIVISASEVADGVRRVDGWITGSPATVELHEVGGQARTQQVDADEHGRFVFEAVRPGPVYFVIHANPAGQDDRPVLTPTFTL